MREKSDASKLSDGRGILNGNCYEAWKTARESKSSGTAHTVYDPTQKRSVNLLSSGEKKVFWVLRFMTSGRILEQFPMDPRTVDLVCDDLGIRKYRRVLSTDFVVEKNSGDTVAFSVKPNASSFAWDTEPNQKNVARAKVESRYWSYYGIEHKIIFSDEIDMNLAMNISDVMFYWDEKHIQNNVDMLMHLIAHKAVSIPMDQGRIPFKLIADKYPMEKYYESFKRHKDDPNFQGWVLDFPGRHSISHIVS